MRILQTALIVDHSRRARYGCALAAAFLACIVWPIFLFGGQAEITNLSFSVALSATPSYGGAPLLVSFQATVTSGSPTSYNWTFGDGADYNGTNSSASNPTHLYSFPGLYNVTVVVRESSGSGQASISVNVVTRLLSAQISSTVLSGSAPLTVSFNSSISGGTGTYVNYTWNFGDGGFGSGTAIRYTFARPGMYHVVLTVFDSGNASTAAGLWENVSVPPASSNGIVSSLLTVLPWIVVGLVVGLAVAWFATRVLTGVQREGRPTTDVESGVESTQTSVLSSTTRAPVEPSLPGQPRKPALAERAPPPAESLFLSQRIVLHIAAQGRLGDDEVATESFTQAGMAASLEVRQNQLTNVLRRLVAASVLEEDVRHIRGRSRRLKVYRLTERGERLASELRRRGRV